MSISHTRLLIMIQADPAEDSSCVKINKDFDKL